MSLATDIPIPSTLKVVRRFLFRTRFVTPNPDDHKGYKINLDHLAQCGEELRDLGFTGSFSNGVSKVCFPHTSDWVLKVPLTQAFWRLVEKETILMKSAPPEYRKYFPENVLMRYAVLQEKCELDHKRYPEAYHELAQVKAALNLVDLHNDNVGWNKAGQLKIIDAQRNADLNAVWQYRPSSRKSPATPRKVA